MKTLLRKRLVPLALSLALLAGQGRTGGGQHEPLPGRPPLGLLLPARPVGQKPRTGEWNALPAEFPLHPRPDGLLSLAAGRFAERLRHNEFPRRSRQRDLCQGRSVGGAAEDHGRHLLHDLLPSGHLHQSPDRDLPLPCAEVIFARAFSSGKALFCISSRKTLQNLGVSCIVNRKCYKMTPRK